MHYTHIIYIETVSLLLEMYTSQNLILTTPLISRYLSSRCLLRADDTSFLFVWLVWRVALPYWVHRGLLCRQIRNCSPGNNKPLSLVCLYLIYTISNFLKSELGRICATLHPYTCCKELWRILFSNIEVFLNSTLIFDCSTFNWLSCKINHFWISS